MHYSCLVALPPGFDGDASEAVERLLAPYDENLDLEQDPDYPDLMHNPRSFWDWWQIGGRWTGYLSGYEPALDPANVETCRLCGGSGVRPGGLEDFGQAWFDGCGGCNGCGGLGSAVKWPTSFAKHGGDVQRWADVKETVLSGDKSFYSVVAGEAVAHRERYVPNDPDGNHFHETGEVLPLLQTIPDDAIVVVVDYHN